MNQKKTANLRTLRFCLSLLKIKAAESTQYRMAGLTGAVVSIFWALIEIVVYSVFYRYADNNNAGILAGMTLSQLVSYIWIGQVLFILSQMNVDDEIRDKIVSGDVGIELCRPISLYWHWYAKSAASRIAPLIWRGGPVILAGIFIQGGYGLSGPVSALSLLLFLLSVLSAFFLAVAFSMLNAVIRMAVSWGDGPTYMLMLLSGVLAGNYLPLQLWPDFMQKFLFFQPFAGMTDIPARLYVGTMPHENVFTALAVQIIWTVAFIFLGQMLLQKRLKSIIVQGG